MNYKGSLEEKYDSLGVPCVNVEEIPGWSKLLCSIGGVSVKENLTYEEVSVEILDQ